MAAPARGTSPCEGDGIVLPLRGPGAERLIYEPGKDEVPASQACHAARLAFQFVFHYYLTQGLQHLEREADHAALLASDLQVQGFIVVVDEHFGEEPLVVAETLCPHWDGFVLYTLGRRKPGTARRERKKPHPKDGVPG